MSEKPTQPIGKAIKKASQLATPSTVAPSSRGVEKKKSEDKLQRQLLRARLSRLIREHVGSMRVSAKGMKVLSDGIEDTLFSVLNSAEHLARRARRREKRSNCVIEPVNIGEAMIDCGWKTEGRRLSVQRLRKTVTYPAFGAGFKEMSSNPVD